MFLARTATDVNVVIRHDDLSRDMSRYLAERIRAALRVHVWNNCEVCELRGDERLEEVVVRNVRTDERRSLRATALFVLIGSEPHTRWLEGPVELDERGFIMTGVGLGGAAMFQTSTDGVFAIGDVRSGSVKRVASAVGDGAVAVRLVYEHLVRAGRR
ncbi:Thioredoxin reductase [Microbacterium trichothecenolyticum]|uniref:Thioredoxin reductase n=2 Tax=Microbacterium trichothecenolyticum TaxID=69370 RepID=A0A0M2HIJ5_MICTR|nr:Thioredoxin reductase [Microbacterium trichothecenolyticum]